VAMMKQLPYKWIAGITPCPKGWLIVPARLAGVTVVVEDCEVVKTLFEVVDFKPKFDAAAINIPMGFRDEPLEEGECEHEAREMVGWPRRVAVRGIPSRAALRTTTKSEARAIEPWLTNDDLRRFRWLREAEKTFQPFHQRNFFSANPELSYTLLNEDRPLKTSPFHQDGVIERMNLIRNKLPGVEEIIQRTPPPGAGQYHVVQAAGLLWTARRAVGRAINRLPIDPSWDESGLRVELVR
jgi:predicted RNase H-like nuclease